MLIAVETITGLEEKQKKTLQGDWKFIQMSQFDDKFLVFRKDRFHIGIANTGLVLISRLLSD